MCDFEWLLSTRLCLVPCLKNVVPFIAPSFRLSTFNIVLQTLVICPVDCEKKLPFIDDLFCALGRVMT